MSPIFVLAGSKLIAASIAASLARIGAAQACDQWQAALEAVRHAAAAVLIVHPRFSRGIDLAPMRRLTEYNPSARCILLVDEEVEPVANATAGLPPHCRVSLSGDPDALIACIREGRSRLWGRSDDAAPGDGESSVTLPDGVVLSAALAEVLRLHCLGYSAVKIAETRNVSARTVETQMKAIRERTGVKTNVLLVLRYAGWARG